MGIARDEKMVCKVVAINAQTVNATASVSSAAMRISYGSEFSYILKLSGTTPSVNLTYKVTDSDVNNADDVCTNHDHTSAWISPANNGTLATNVSSTTADSFSPVVTKWVQFTVTGTSGNGTDTKATLVLMYQ